MYTCLLGKRWWKIKEMTLCLNLFIHYMWNIHVAEYCKYSIHSVEVFWMYVPEGLSFCHLTIWRGCLLPLLSWKQSAYMSVFLWRPPKNRARSRSGQEDQGRSWTGFTFTFSVCLHGWTTFGVIVKCPRLRLRKADRTGQEPGHRGSSSGPPVPPSHLPLPVPCSISYPSSGLPNNNPVSVLIASEWIKKHPGSRGQKRERLICVCVCDCSIHGMLCMRTVHLSAQLNTVLHTNTQQPCPLHIYRAHTSWPQPSPPFSFLSGFPSSGLPSSSPPPRFLLVPFLVPDQWGYLSATTGSSHSDCLLCGDLGWAPGAGRGARNGLVPVAARVKGTVAPFPSETSVRQSLGLFLWWKWKTLVLSLQQSWVSGWFMTCV